MNDYATAIEAARSEIGAAASDFLTDTCAVSRYTDTSDGQGGAGRAYTTVSGMSAIPCSYKATRGGEQQAADSVKARCEYVITLPVRLGDGTAVDLLARDRIVIAARDSQPARTFEVVTVKCNATALLMKADANTSA